MKSKYTPEQRMEIGREIYDRMLTVPMAAAKYGINLYTARDYLRMYKASINAVLPVKDRCSVTENNEKEYSKMSRNELLDEIMRLRKKMDSNP